MRNKTVFYLIALTLLVWPAFCERVIIFSGESLSLGENLTLAAEDADPATGRVWITLQNQSATYQSVVLDLGEQIDLPGINVTLEGVYAGDKKDLITLDIERHNLSTNSTLDPQTQPSLRKVRDKWAVESGNAQTSPWAKMLLEYGRDLMRGLYHEDIIHLS